MAIKKVAMIIFMQPDIETAVTFYKNIGLSLVFHIKNRWAEFELAGIKIALCPTTSPLSDYRTGLVLEVQNIDQLYQFTRDSVTFMGEPVQTAQGIMASVKDPGGNIIDLYELLPSKAQVLFGDLAQKGTDRSCCQQEASSCCAQPERACC